jgi:hypothetical protein
MTPAADSGGRTRRVLLHVAGLEGPPIGGGCCAVSRDALVLEELDSRPGLLTLHVDPDAETVLVRVTDDADLDYAVETLNDRGMPTTVIDEPGPGPGEAGPASPQRARDAWSRPRPVLRGGTAQPTGAPDMVSRGPQSPASPTEASPATSPPSIRTHSRSAAALSAASDRPRRTSSATRGSVTR